MWNRDDAGTNSKAVEGQVPPTLCHKGANLKRQGNQREGGKELNVNNKKELSHTTNVTPAQAVKPETQVTSTSDQTIRKSFWGYKGD